MTSSIKASLLANFSMSILFSVEICETEAKLKFLPNIPLKYCLFPFTNNSAKTVIESKINNKESFYLYVGDSLCPWCRSGLEKMIEVAKKEKVKKIYYVDFWDDDHNEILRDLYDVEEKDGVISVVKIKDGLSGYNTLLNAVSDFVQDYTLTKDGKEYETGVKRIYGGDHFYFDNGKCVRYVSLRSDKLSNANDELTDEVLEDQENKFTHFLTSNSSQ